MESVAKPDRQRMLKALAFWCFYALEDEEPDDSVLEKLGFGSVNAMRIQLGNWEVPDWVTEKTPTVKDAKAPTHAPGEKKARGSGEITDLPPAANAMSIFRGAIEKLSVFVERLPLRKEHRQGGRFVVTYAKSLVETPEPGEEYGYLETSADAEPGEHGSTSFALLALGDPYRRVAGGASRHPDDGLSAAIATALLTGTTTDELLEVLHPAPTQDDRKKARKLVEGKDGLKKRAGQLAALMRGYPVGQGHRTNEVSKEWQSAAWVAQERWGYGYNEKEIARWLNEQDTFLPELKKSRQVTVKDVRDLLSLDLEPYAGFKDLLNRKL
jgi:hypothetical protein